MRSMLTAGMPAAIAEATERRISSGPWMRPMASRARASKLWAPTESRLTPAARSASNGACSPVPGLTSRVISAS